MLDVNRELHPPPAFDAVTRAYRTRNRRHLFEKRNQRRECGIGLRVGHGSLQVIQGSIRVRNNRSPSSMRSTTSIPPTTRPIDVKLPSLCGWTVWLSV